MEKQAGGHIDVRPIKVDDRVDKPSDLCGNRDSAEAHGAKLGQTARFKSRWDQDRVGAGLHQMGQIFIMAEDASDMALMRSCKCDSGARV